MKKVLWDYVFMGLFSLGIIVALAGLVSGLLNVSFAPAFGIVLGFELLVIVTLVVTLER